MQQKTRSTTLDPVTDAALLDRAVARRKIRAAEVSVPTDAINRSFVIRELLRMALEAEERGLALTGDHPELPLEPMTT